MDFCTELLLQTAHYGRREDDVAYGRKTNNEDFHAAKVGINACFCGTFRRFPYEAFFTQNSQSSQSFFFDFQPNAGFKPALGSITSNPWTTMRQL